MTPRPAADDLINEIIFDKKCNQKGSREAFFKWCNGETFGVKNVTCKDLSGSKGLDCILEAAFYPQPNGTKKDPPNFDKYKPLGIEVGYVCPNKVNSEKSVVLPVHKTPFADYEEFLKITKYCRQELYGIYGLAWWIILLIVLAAIVVVGIAFYIFWIYYLRRKIYKKNNGMTSEFTSKPFSSTSAIESHKPRSTSRSRSRSRSRSGSRPSGVAGSSGPSKQGSNHASRASTGTKRSTLAG